MPENNQINDITKKCMKPKAKEAVRIMLIENKRCEMKQKPEP